MARLQDDPQLGERGAGLVLLTEPGAAGDTIAIKRVGDAWPWLLIDPIAGAVYVGNGVTAPVTPLGSGGGGGTAASTTFAPGGSVGSTNVQAAILEVASEYAAADAAHAGIVDGTAHGINTRIAAELAAHVALADPHPIYLTPTEANAAYDAIGLAAAAAAASQPLDADLTAIAALGTQAFGRSLLTAVDAPAARALLALGLLATKGVADSATITWNTSGSDIIGTAQVPRFANLFVSGHSFASLIGGDSAQRDLTWPRRLAARLQMNPRELALQAKAASYVHNNFFVNPNLFAGPGIGGILRSVYPSSSYAKSTLRDTQPARARAWPHLGVHLWGINDLNFGSNVAYGTLTPYAEISPAVKDGYRTMVSRLRAKRIFDVAHPAWSAWSFGAQTARSSATRKRFRPITAGGQAATFTIPADARAGDVLVFAFHAGPNGYALINQAAGVAAGDPTMDLDDNGALASFPTTYPFTVQVDAERMTVTGRTLGTNSYRFAITRGVDGTVAAFHADNAVVRRASRTQVVASGTAGWTDTVVLDGRGAAGSPQTVTIRKVLTEAMIGKTIIWTSGNYLAEPLYPVGIDAAWIEDQSPPWELLVEVWRQQKKGTLTDQQWTDVAAYNADLATVAAEFSNVAVVPAEAYFSSRFACVLRAGSSLSSADAPGTARTISITPDTFASFQVAAGQSLGVDNEELLITSVVNNGTFYTLGVLRGSNGTTPVTAVAGKQIFMLTAVGSDQIHPSDHGHLLIQNCIYDTIVSLPISGDAAGLGGTYGGEHPTYPAANPFADEHWLWPAGARAACVLTNLPGANFVEWLMPFEIYDQYHLTALALWWSAVPGAVRDYNFIVRRANNQGGGEVLQYVTGTKPATTGGFELPFDLPLKPGRYFFGLQPITAVTSLGTVRGHWPAVDVPSFNQASTALADPGFGGGFIINHAGADPTLKVGADDLLLCTAGSGALPMFGMKGAAPPRD